MLRLRRALALARDARGFTLIETLVAMVTGIAVTGALFTILEVSTKQAVRLSDVAQATQVGRTAMTHIVDELHSGCLYDDFAPVQPGSTESKLIFVNGYFPEKANEATQPEYTFVHKDEITWSNAGKGTLKDKKFTATEAAKEQEYTAWKENGEVLVAENISQVEPVKENPVFKYYKYSSSSANGTSEAAATLTPMEVSGATALTAAQAKEVAAVGVTFRSAPYTKELKLSAASEKGTPLDQTTLTTFAFSAPNSETTIVAGPCE